MPGAPDGTVFRASPDRRGLAMGAIYAVAAALLASGVLGLSAGVRWGLAALCLLVAVASAHWAVQRAARTEVRADGIRVRVPPRRASRHAWADVAGFDAGDVSDDPDDAVRAGRRVRMRLRSGEAVELPGVAGPEADAVAAGLGARLPDQSA